MEQHLGAAQAAGDDSLERRTMRKVMWRLLPLMALMFLVNFLDRVNVSFAALTMNADIGLTPLAYAWGAGIFFIAYFVFEVPSNLIMERVGARLWMARIMITWGLIAGATAFAYDATSFIVIRFLLGAAEAGLVPGILLYITYWFPPRYRGRAVAYFLLAAPLANAIAGMLSAPLLAMSGVAGLAGWQWMFIVEAVPALVLAVIVLVFLTDTPAKARWLADDERRWLEGQCEKAGAHATIGQQLKAMLNRRVALLSAIYFGRTTAMYGIGFFLPLIIKGMGLSNTQTGLVAAVPFAIATVAALAWGYSSDRANERHWHTIWTMLFATAGLAGAALIGPSTWALIAITLAAIGLYSQPGVFWSLPPMMLPTAVAGAGIAVINSLGNLGGFIGPYLIGWIQQLTGSYSGGLYVMAGFAALSAGLGVLLSKLNWETRRA
jgi:ACS family tartrate transporter-like MFS transporter